LTRTFKVDQEFIKGEFPHDWMSHDKLDYVGPHPTDSTISEWDCRAASRIYLEKDCVGLFQV